MNPYLVSTIVAVGFAVVLRPWNISLNRMSSPSLLIIIGTVFVFVGLTVKTFQNKLFIESEGIGWGLLTGFIYAGTILALNYALHPPVIKSNPAIVVAITATYPIITAIIEIFRTGVFPTLKEGICILLTVCGVIGLTLSGSKN